MVYDIAEYLKNKLLHTNILAAVHGVADLISETKSDGTGVKRYPAIYKGKDSLRYITNFDYKNGLGFFIGDEGTKEQGESKVGGQFYFNQNPNLTFYAITRKIDELTEQKFADILAALLSINNGKAARKEIGVNTINIYPSQIETGYDNVIPDIFENIDFKAVHDLCYVKITLDVNVSYYNNCRTEKCC